MYTMSQYTSLCAGQRVILIRHGIFERPCKNFVKYKPCYTPLYQKSTRQKALKVKNQNFDYAAEQQMNQLMNRRTTDNLSCEVAIATENLN